jgi:two-component system, cell cycle response regulator
MIVKATPDSDDAASGRACLVVLSGAEIGREITIQDCPVIVGRSAAAQIYVNAVSVSRRHARIDFREEGDQGYHMLSDLASSNGTFVNGAPAANTPIHHGDRIRMGDIIFKFIVQDDVETRFHKDIHRLIHYDQLTGLLTMEAFRGEIEAQIRRHEAGGVFALAMTDLDGLKKVNDTHGHLAGRMVIREMGAIIRRTLRAQDAAGLYGGDECIIIYPESKIETAAEVAEKLRAAIADFDFDYQGNGFRISISQGLAEWPRDGKTPEALIAAADRALYRAKAEGRNRVCLAETA